MRLREYEEMIEPATNYFNNVSGFILPQRLIVFHGNGEMRSVDFTLDSIFVLLKKCL